MDINVKLTNYTNDELSAATLAVTNKNIFREKALQPLLLASSVAEIKNSFETIMSDLIAAQVKAIGEADEETRTIKALRRANKETRANALAILEAAP